MPTIIIAYLPPHKFYAKLAAEISQEPVSGETILLEKRMGSAVVSRVKRSSRKAYADEDTATTEAENAASESLQNIARIPYRRTT